MLFDGLEVDAGVSHSKPVFINYGTSTMYAPSTSSGAVNSGTIFSRIMTSLVILVL